MFPPPPQCTDSQCVFSVHTKNPRNVFCEPAQQWRNLASPGFQIGGKQKAVKCIHCANKEIRSAECRPICILNKHNVWLGYALPACLSVILWYVVVISRLLLFSTWPSIWKTSAILYEEVASLSQTARAVGRLPLICNWLDEPTMIQQ